MGNSKELFILEEDFNALVNPSDKKGGLGWLKSTLEFNNFVTDNGLIKLLFKKGEYTWTIGEKGL